MSPRRRPPAGLHAAGRSGRARPESAPGHTARGRERWRAGQHGDAHERHGGACSGGTALRFPGRSRWRSPPGEGVVAGKHAWGWPALVLSPAVGMLPLRESLNRVFVFGAGTALRTVPSQASLQPQPPPCPSELQNTQPPTPLWTQTDLTLPLLQTPPPRSTASEVLGRHPQGGGCQGHLAVNKPACGWGPRTDSAAGAAPMGLGPI